MHSLNEIVLGRVVDLYNFYQLADIYIPKYFPYRRDHYLECDRHQNLVMAVLNNPDIKEMLKREFPNFNVKHATNITVKDFFNFGEIDHRMAYIMGVCHGKRELDPADQFHLMFVIYHNGKNFQIFTTGDGDSDVYGRPSHDYSRENLRNKIREEFENKARPVIEEYLEQKVKWGF